MRKCLFATLLTVLAIVNAWQPPDPMIANGNVASWQPPDPLVIEDNL